MAPLPLYDAPVDREGMGPGWLPPPGTVAGMEPIAPKGPVGVVVPPYEGRRVIEGVNCTYTFAGFWKSTASPRSLGKVVRRVLTIPDASDRQTYQWCYMLAEVTETDYRIWHKWEGSPNPPCSNVAREIYDGAEQTTGPWGELKCPSDKGGFHFRWPGPEYDEIFEAEKARAWDEIERDLRIRYRILRVDSTP